MMDNSTSLKSKEFLRELLRSFFADPGRRLECSPEIEAEIERTVKELGFESDLKQDKFVQRLRLASMFYPVIPTAYPRRSRRQLRIADNIIKLASEINNEELAEKISVNAYILSALEMVEIHYLYPPWSFNDAVDNFLVFLDTLFLEGSFCKRWRLIANLAAVIFLDGRADLKDEKKWAQQRVERCRKRGGIRPIPNELLDGLAVSLEVREWRSRPSNFRWSLSPDGKNLASELAKMASEKTTTHAACRAHTSRY